MLFEDKATLIGFFIAWIDIYLAHMLNMPVQDGVASVMIGVVLAFSLLLVRNQRFVDGWSSIWPYDKMRLKLHSKILRYNLLVVYWRNKWVRIWWLHLKDELAFDEIEACINWIEAQIKQSYPEIVALFVKPQLQQVWQEHMQGRLGSFKLHILLILFC